MNIAVCDDEPEVIRYVTQEIQRVARGKFPVDIFTYQSGEDMLKRIEEEKIETIILDIDMPDTYGTEIANRIRERWSYIKIIFLTNCEDFVFESIRYQPLRFVRKSHESVELPEAIEAAYALISKEHPYIAIGKGKKQTKLCTADILYVESDEHYVNVHMRTSTLRIRTTMSECEELLQPCGFVRIHMAYLVRMQEVQDIENVRVYLSNGDCLPVSRNHIDEVRLMFGREMECSIDGYYI